MALNRDRSVFEESPYNAAMRAPLDLAQAPGFHSAPFH